VTKNRKGRPKPPRKKVEQYNRPYPLEEASVRKLLEEVVTENPERIRKTVRRGISRGGSVGFQYVQLSAHYLDGKPPVKLQLEPTQPIHFHFHKPKEDEEEVKE